MSELTQLEISKRIAEFKKNNAKYKKSKIVLAYDSLEEGYLFKIDDSFYAIELSKLSLSYSNWGNERLNINLNLDYICEITNGTIVDNILIYDALIKHDDISKYNLNDNIIQQFRNIMLPKEIDGYYYQLPNNISKYKLKDKKIFLMNPFIEIYSLNKKPKPYLSEINTNEQKSIINIFPELYTNNEILEFINSEDNEFREPLLLENIRSINLQKSTALESILLNV